MSFREPQILDRFSQAATYEPINPFLDDITEYYKPTNPFIDNIAESDSFPAAENEYLLRNLDSYPAGPSSKLPNFDKGRTTKLACIWGLALVWVVIVACIAIGIVAVRKGAGESCMYPTTLSTGGAEALSLGVNTLLTLCIEALGYIHGTSLRWALFHEHRLQFNTNLRLFTSARNQPQNGWLANTISTIALVLCYGASSQLFVYGVTYPPNFGEPGIYGNWGTYINGVALLTLALALIVKATIATWILISVSENIITWSSNPLNSTLAVIHHGLEPRAKRCMISVHQRGLDTTPITPLRKQRSAKDANHSILIIVSFAWLLPALALILFSVIVVLSKKTFEENPGNQWYFSSSWTEINTGNGEAPFNFVHLYMRPPQNLTAAPIWTLGLLIISAVQATQTLSFHAIELIVNMSRDEEAWRSATNKKRGARLASKAFLSASLSWQTVILFIAKALLHWLLGQTLLLSFRQMSAEDPSMFFLHFYLMYIKALVYFVGTTALGAFTTFLAFRRFRGPQPAAFGYLQTLADLIDEWQVNEKGRFWWGDKGSGEDEIQHAGTCNNWEALGEVQMNGLYAG
jgi:hypothetical protein